MPKTITPTTVAEFIADRLAAIDKTQREVAEACGFVTPNIITMFKKGDMKVPLDRIGALAKSLDVDPAHLLRLAMQEYMPDTWSSIEEILHSTVLSANELELVRKYRQATGDSDAQAMVVDRDAVLAIVLA
ncbi:helix-turn-helix transcriptional regulator [Thiobacillus sp.]|jgi:transcriptional regulator with XRE-family HTH domain|uniref:helix-turn-helix domain-containing protein n=1 Tax=Thiobacillus sp. TaxID=924 RepID=UPI0025FEB232|nr:helix-turn-helix transcriptional regulator [Thiobacillus sp.]